MMQHWQKLALDQNPIQRMLARLQQFLTLGALTLACGWLSWCWHLHRPGPGLLGAAALVLGYATLLGIEFALMRLQGRGRPAQCASLAQLLRAWWGEVCEAPRVFCWRQPFRSARWPDHLPVDAAAKCGLVLIHGYVCNRGLWNAWLQRLTQQGTPFIAVNLEPVFGSIDDYVPVIESAVSRLQAATGRPPVAVAHSMGGLALRRWWVEHSRSPSPGGASRIAHAVTLGTPHHGTWLARFAFSLNARQMRLGSSWLRALQQRESPDFAAQCTCYYSHCDNIVFPTETATLPGADNRHLAAVAHVHMADHPEPWAHVLDLLARSGDLDGKHPLARQNYAGIDLA